MAVELDADTETAPESALLDPSAVYVEGWNEQLTLVRLLLQLIEMVPV